MSMHYLNGQETALYKLGFMGMTPEQLKLIAAQTGMGAVGGGAAGALAADEGNGLAGGLTGAATGGLLAGGLSTLARGFDRDMAQKLLHENLVPLSPEARKLVTQAVDKPHAPVTAGKALGAAPIGAAAGYGSGKLVNSVSGGEDKTASKLAFLGLSPDGLKHIGLRAAGGAAAGAGAGAIAGGEDNRLSGALAGGALGGLTAGGLSAGNKLMGRANAQQAFGSMGNASSGSALARRSAGAAPHNTADIEQVLRQMQQVEHGITPAGRPGTMLGGAAVGALPGMVGGRMQRDE